MIAHLGSRTPPASVGWVLLPVPWVLSLVQAPSTDGAAIHLDSGGDFID